jgi:hypothetical protein
VHSLEEIIFTYKKCTEKQQLKFIIKFCTNRMNVHVVVNNLLGESNHTLRKHKIYVAASAKTRCLAVRSTLVTINRYSLPNSLILALILIIFESINLLSSLLVSCSFKIHTCISRYIKLSLHFLFT